MSNKWPSGAYEDADGYICVRDGVYLTRYWQNGEVKDVKVVGPSILSDTPADPKDYLPPEITNAT